MTTAPTPMCRYHYDALDLIAGMACADQASLQRFYRRQHLVTERQGQASQSVFQHGEQLLAVQSSENDTLKSQLLATDQQRSVLQLIDSLGSLPKVYTPYGHHRAESGLSSLLGFNGERRDPVTGCYLLGNGRRGFNPVLMRFNSPDRLSPFGQGGLNSYAYCLGDPVNFSDPTGEIVRLITSILSVSNTRLGMSRAIPSYNLAKDALRFGALRHLPARQSFAAVSTVAASGAILATGLVGVASAVVAIVEDPEAAAILGYVALGLTTLAIASRVGTYWAMRKPGTDAALRSFVKNKGQVITATPPASSRPSSASSMSLEASAPPQTPGTFRSGPVTVGGKRSYDEMIELEFDRPILKARRLREPSNSNKKIRRA